MQTVARFVTLAPVLRAVSAWCAVMLCTSEAAAFTLHVLAPSELRVAPSVRADRSAVTFAVSLRDDRGAPVVGAVRVDVRSASTSTQRTLQTDPLGQATMDVPVRRDDHVIEVRGQFSGDSTRSSATTELRVDVDAPFVSVVLQSVPASVNVESRAAVELVASVEVGRVSLASPLGWPVQFYIDNNPVGTVRSDATGRAALRLEGAQFQTPGVRTVRAAAQLRGTELWSAERRLIVRALTSVVATADRDERTGQLRVHGAVAWRGGGVAGATVRVESNQTQVAAALTDAVGAFELTVPARSQTPGAKARVVFVPTTPWLSGAESGEFYLAPPLLPPVSWRYALAPLALGALVFALLRLRPKPSQPKAAQQIEDGVELEESAVADAPSVVVSVVDRSTGLPIEGASVSLGGVVMGESPTPFAPGSKLSLTVRADGYASRELSITVRAAGAVRLKVALSRWREAVYAVAREVMLAPPAPKAPPTLEEAAEVASVAHKPLFAEAQRGAYGPDEPGEHTLKRVQDLAESTKHGEH